MGSSHSNTNESRGKLVEPLYPQPDPAVLAQALQIALQRHGEAVKTGEESDRSFESSEEPWESAPPGGSMD